MQAFRGRRTLGNGQRKAEIPRRIQSLSLRISAQTSANVATDRTPAHHVFRRIERRQHGGVSARHYLAKMARQSCRLHKSVSRWNKFGHIHGAVKKSYYLFRYSALSHRVPFIARRDGKYSQQLLNSAGHGASDSNVTRSTEITELFPSSAPGRPARQEE